jgi:hypothetical protein
MDFNFLVNINEFPAILVTVFGITIEVISLLINAAYPIDLAELSMIKLPVHPLASFNTPDEVSTEYVPLPQAKVLISAFAAGEIPISSPAIKTKQIDRRFITKY